MSISIVTLIAHLALLYYSTMVVCVRVHDRRAPSHERIQAIRASWMVAVFSILVAATFDFLDGGKKLQVVSNLWDLSLAMCCLNYGLAIRILRGERKLHGVGNSQRTRRHGDSGGDCSGQRDRRALG